MAQNKTPSTSLAARLADLGLPPLDQLLDLVLGDQRTARRLVNILDHLQARQALERAGCVVREGLGFSLKVRTPAGHEVSVNQYATGASTRRLSVSTAASASASERSACIEIIPEELPAVVAWIPSLADALATRLPPPAWPVPVAAGNCSAPPTSAAAAVAIARHRRK